MILHYLSKGHPPSVCSFGLAGVHPLLPRQIDHLLDPAESPLALHICLSVVLSLKHHDGPTREMSWDWLSGNNYLGMHKRLHYNNKMLNALYVRDKVLLGIWANRWCAFKVVPCDEVPFRILSPPLEWVT